MLTGLQIARDNLEQAKAYQPKTDVERRAKATNIAQIEAYIAKAEKRTAS